VVFAVCGGQKCGAGVAWQPRPVGLFGRNRVVPEVVTDYLGKAGK
jgi:hypothetical protein